MEERGEETDEGVTGEGRESSGIMRTVFVHSANKLSTVQLVDTRPSIHAAAT